ncbi:N-6 DNA methylase [Soehngenia longivitae]|uniref:N-6 DNA methylase n=1 Tax=Soehngenia longivitae TaxID=2562294 RepID=UPI001ADEB51B|nr:N-6 DNA methylase [Soehngenia longivitae]
MKFAQESGKNKGQFYTPSGVSNTFARLIGIGEIKQETDEKWTLHEIIMQRLIQFNDCRRSLQLAG